jgi:hypothetical protein
MNDRLAGSPDKGTAVKLVRTDRYLMAVADIYVIGRTRRAQA